MIIYNFSLWLCKKLIHWYSGARFLQKPLCSTQCHRAKDFRLVLLSNQLIHYFIYFHHIKVVALPTAKPRISGGLSLYRQADFVSHFTLSISFQWHIWYCKVMVWKSPDKCQLTHIIFPNEACMPVYISLILDYFADMDSEITLKWISKILNSLSMQIVLYVLSHCVHLNCPTS